MRIRTALSLAVTFIVVLISGTPYAQNTFEDLVREGDDKFKQLQKEADEELEGLKKVDKEFAEILDRAWKELELETGIEPDPTPKPPEPPVARPADVPEPEPEKPAPPKPEPQKPKPQIIEKKVEIKPVEGTPLPFVFFNTSLKITCDADIRSQISTIITKDTILKFWEKMGVSDYEKLCDQALELKTKLHLNDWGYCMLLDTISGTLYGRSLNERKLFMWFMLVHSGYDARVGFRDDTIHLLLPSANILYSTPYFEIDTKKYYIVFMDGDRESMKSLKTYEGSYKTAENMIDLNIYSAPDFTKSIEQRKFTFRYSGKEYSLSVPVNKNIIDFYDRYPLTNLNVYFKASLSEEAGNALLGELKPIIRDFPEPEAVNILLRFVQTAFDYETDDSQFGREKPFFKEETFYYPYSDCEDRSFLFAFLVKNLLGLDVIGLHYPGHVATAVKFSEDTEGDFINFNNSKYIICDPTYINAHYGECMPKFKEVTPEAITM